MRYDKLKMSFEYMFRIKHFYWILYQIKVFFDSIYFIGNGQTS